MGAGTSSGKSGVSSVSATSNTTSGNLTKSQITKAVQQQKYTDNGNGTWSFDIEGIGGVQVLDETGGSHDPMLGHGGKIYGVNVWDNNYAVHGPTQYINGSINQAKTLGKKILRGIHNA